MQANTYEKVTLLFSIFLFISKRKNSRETKFPAIEKSWKNRFSTVLHGNAFNYACTSLCNNEMHALFSLYILFKKLRKSSLLHSLKEVNSCKFKQFRFLFHALIWTNVPTDALIRTNVPIHTLIRTNVPIEKTPIQHTKRTKDRNGNPSHGKDNQGSITLEQSDERFFLDFKQKINQWLRRSTTKEYNRIYKKTIDYQNKRRSLEIDALINIHHRQLIIKHGIVDVFYQVDEFGIP